MSTSEKEYVQHGVAMTCRSFQEYVDMFQLTPGLLSKGEILDVAGGASSFVADACRKGYFATAVDPLYDESPQSIAHLGERERQEVVEKLAGLLDVYDWAYYGSLERHVEIREQSLSRFLEDYSNGQAQSRYVIGRLPQLPFPDNNFALVLSSHFLFLYEEQFDAAFHTAAIRELIRVTAPGGEIRLYPLSSLRRRTYAHLDTIVEDLRRDSRVFEVSFVDTPFRFLKTATQYLRIVRHM